MREWAVLGRSPDARLPTSARVTVAVLGLVPLLGLGLWAVLPLGSAPSAGRPVPVEVTSTTETTGSTDTAGSTETTAPSSTESQADFVTELDSLLHRTHDARDQVKAAVQDAAACGSDLGGDADRVRAAAAERDRLADAASTVDANQVTGGDEMRGNLVSLLRTSANADREYAAWIDDLRVQCTQLATNQHLSAATQLSASATKAKQVFVADWNGIAAARGLTTWQEGDL
ncbi:hypothetical protein [Actinokineospora inagensis]|uniref:hypothetical protein n=1 Tax=Actinokineospora inagensis TaxID=103730 RepID=UPI000417F2DD|nr:hypothetical protein [Actinokineospora inagensis]